MARLPEDRYATAGELCEDLVAVSERRTTSARQEQGSLAQRAWTQLRFYTSGHAYEYKSSRTLLGLPLMHVISGRRAPGQPMRKAKGWFAVGDVAVGGIACGGIACGAIACGGLSAGLLFSWGGLSAALLFAIGGVAVGLVPMGGLALGYLAFGGVALGYGAMGGFARGRYAVGGNADGEFLMGDGPGTISPREWFEGVLPWIAGWFGSGGG